MNVPRVKVCGMTRLEDALLAQELGAWAVGFVFFPGSPRNIDPRQARAIADRLSPSIEKIGVFVNPDFDEVSRIHQEAGLTKVQLHGTESPEFCSALGDGVIKVFRFSDRERVSEFSGLFAGMVDAERAKDGRWGGTGHLGDWEFARKLKTRLPVILAGGISATNVLDAVREVEPFALDLSSSVESGPGKKDPEKVREFFAILRGRKS